MSDWQTLDVLPAIGDRVLVAAWEFGCAPVYAVCIFWQSSMPEQPPKFYFEEPFRNGYNNHIAQIVRYWLPIPELPGQERDNK